MPDYEIDVTQRSVGTFALKTPDGRIEYDILPLTRGPMLLFDQMRSHDTDGSTLDENAKLLIECIAALLAPHNGEPPAREVFDQMWQDGYLSLEHLRGMQEFFVEKAAGSPPA